LSDLIADRREELVGADPAGDQRRNPPQCGLLVGKSANGRA
jgi:hypothetical protein